MSTIADPVVLAAELESASPRHILQRALREYGSELAISFSGAEDVLLIEFAHQLGERFRVFTIDTGRLHPETYRYLAKVEQHYGIRIEVCMPEASAVEAMVRTKGLFSFYEDGHQQCCSLRKVDPLRRKLSNLRSWVTGQRRDQSPGTRRGLAVVEADATHRGEGDAPLIKWNPLATSTNAEVWDSIRAFEVPFNPLHERGMVSIGCEPCTRPILPGEHERAGRWWWEEATKRECGLHRAPGTAADD